MVSCKTGKFVNTQICKSALSISVHCGSDKFISWPLIAGLISRAIGKKTAFKLKKENQKSGGGST